MKRSLLARNRVVRYCANTNGFFDGAAACRLLSSLSASPPAGIAPSGICRYIEMSLGYSVPAACSADWLSCPGSSPATGTRASTVYGPSPRRSMAFR